MTATDTASPPGTRKRRDIQALRALAVTLVVAYHIAPGRVPGGYVGVDVFFVISGFLITGALARELDRTSRVRLGQFWARRARRLLPASLATLAVTLVAMLMWMPQTQWANVSRHIAGSALYVENWLLAVDAVDYFAAENAPTPVQHFWSLAVEEQFYLVWPLLFVAVAVATTRSRRMVLTVLISLVLTTSLASSALATAADPASAYFFTHTRAWEFAAGGLLALAPSMRAPAQVRAVIAWVGIGAITWSAFALSGQTAFPGLIALVPVLGTVAVIVSEPGDQRYSPMLVGRLAPVQRAGDTSYSIYLWHWPVVVLLPYVWDGVMPIQATIAAVVLTLLLAELSFRWLETPIRAHPSLVSRPASLSIVAALALSAVVAVSAISVRTGVEARTEEDRVVLPEPDVTAACRGAQSVFSAEECADVEVAPVVPTVLAAPEDRVATCMQDQDAAELRVCESGVPLEMAAEVVVVVGDSHAMHWVPAVREVANSADWHVIEILKQSCPFTTATRLADNPSLADSCSEWNTEVSRYLAGRADITMLFTSASAANPYVPLGSAPPPETDEAVERMLTEYPARRNVSVEEAVAGVTGFVAAWESLPSSIRHVYALRDTARPRPNVVDCLAELGELGGATDSSECALETKDSLIADPLALAVEFSDERVELIDIVSALCERDVCEPIIGGVVVYRDGHHMTESFARTLGPELGRQVGVPDVAPPDLSGAGRV